MRPERTVTTQKVRHLALLQETRNASNPVLLGCCHLLLIVMNFTVDNSQQVGVGKSPKVGRPAPAPPPPPRRAATAGESLPAPCVH